MLDSITRVDQSSPAIRRVMVDTLGGNAFWLELEPTASGSSFRGSTPQAAADAFLSRYGPRALGIAEPATDLHPVKTRIDGDIAHFRYQQTGGGYRVIGAQVAVHVARVPGGHAVQSANGWLVPDVAPPGASRIGRRAAETAALAAGSGRLARANWDTVPALVPHESGTRLAYLVPVTESTFGGVTRYVDAATGTVFAQASAAGDWFASSGIGPAKLTGAATSAPDGGRSGVGRTRRGGMGYYTLVQQKLDWLNNVRDFGAWYNLTNYEMRDPYHAGTEEIVILNDASNAPCNGNELPVVARADWDSSAAARAEVSTIHNLGLSVSFFKSKFGRDGMGNTNAKVWACVHIPAGAFGAAWSQSEGAFRFSAPAIELGVLNGPGGAAEDLVTHEFTHGTSHHEVPGGFDTCGNNFVNCVPGERKQTSAVSEGLGDYFGARQIGATCQAQGVWNSHPCDELSGHRRQIASTKTLADREAQCDGGQATYHCLGILLASALWAATQNLPAAGDDEVDWSTYNGLRDYMLPTTTFLMAREAIVRAAKDRERVTPIQSLYPIVHELETQFYNRGIGSSPVIASVGETACGQWVLSASASGTFALAFQSGNGLYPDGGVWNATTQELGNFTTATLPASFSAASLNGHTGADGHFHSFRLRFTASSGAVGTLDYYAGHGPYCGSFVVTATVPSLVTVKTTYSLTGSASSAAANWLWEQNVDGGAYGYWSNQQNSSFLAYNGTYTLGWRLSATGTSYGTTRDTAWAETRVCIPYNPATCGYALRVGEHAGAPATSAGGRTAPKTAGDHFGSGLWLAVPDGAAKRLIRMYAFSGRHDTSTTAVPWPNILERDGGDWTYATPAGALTLATRRHPAGEHRTLLRITGRLVGRGTRTLALGLAADPDLDEPADDALGFDPDLGMVWVRDGSSARHVGYLPLAGAPTVLVQQFGGRLDDAPESAARALDLMRAPTRIAAGEPADVRFLLTGPDVAVRGDGGFDATYAVLHAASERELLELARATRRDAAALLAGLAGQASSLTADAFGLRQSLGASAFSASGAGSGASAVAQLQANGLTALDYSVPTGREARVRIKLYNSRGQLVRTLVDQPVAGGSYHLEWDRLNERGQPVSPGVYVAVMEAGGFRATRKLVVTR
jgi:hypothetical protein